MDMVPPPPPPPPLNHLNNNGVQPLNVCEVVQEPLLLLQQQDLLSPSHSCSSSSPSPPSSSGGGRRHFRQFCHCHCSCIHKCHHEHEECAEDTERLLSPKMTPNILPVESGRRRRRSGCFLPAESLASVVAEMKTGQLNRSASLSSNDTLKLQKRQLSDYALERDLGEGAYAFVKQGRLRQVNDDVDGDGNKEESLSVTESIPSLSSSTSLLPPPVVIKMVIKSKLLAECILHDFETGLSLPVELYALRHLREHPHPNIVSMEDAFEDALYYYIVMPLHGKGVDLFETIERHETFLPPDRVARIFSQTLMAIAHLHNVLGLVHRDIKDENIIIDSNDRIQLIDFGSCAYYRSGAPHVQHDVPLTEADVRCGQRLANFTSFYGTADYAPPEVVRGESYDGPQQDMWALGVLLYTLSFKEVPFRSPSDILAGRLRLPFTPSPEISTLIIALLSPDPACRPTATQLVHDPWIRFHYAKAMGCALDNENSCDSLKRELDQL